MQKLLTIKGKIVMLAIVGIAGLLFTATTNFQLNLAKQKNIQVSSKSMEILLIIHKEVLIISTTTTRHTMLIEFGKQHDHAQKLFTELDEITKNNHISSIVKILKENENRLAAIFKSITKNNSAIYTQKKKILKEATSVTASVQEIVDAINLKERELFKKGHFLSPELTTLRDEIKDVLNIANARIINIQNLFLSNDSRLFTTRSGKLYKKTDSLLKAVDRAISSTDGNEYSINWMLIKESFSTIKKLEKAVFSQLEKNMALHIDLTRYNADALNAANSIVLSTQKTINNKTAASRTTALIIVCTTLCLMVLLSTVVLRTTVTPVKTVVARLKEISEGDGDLTRRLEIGRKDELGALSAAFNTFAEKIRNTIMQVTDNSTELHDSAENLSTIANQLVQGVELTSGRADAVAVASEEMNANMTSVAAAMEQAATNVSLVATATEEMTSSIREIAHNTGNATSMSQQAVVQTAACSEQVTTLGLAANDIGNVLDTITDISEQVNLLALNATIEAARAGEAGKGFAVVANEIKELAKQTSSATMEISTKVKGIQKSTKGTINGISSISDIINDVNDIVEAISAAIEEQQITTDEISENISQASSGIMEVNENVTQSAEVVDIIAQDIMQVNEAAQQMAESSSNVNKNAHIIRDLAEKLNHLVSIFKV